MTGIDSSERGSADWKTKAHRTQRDRNHYRPINGATMCHRQAIHDSASCSQPQNSRFRLILAVESYEIHDLTVSYPRSLGISSLGGPSRPRFVASSRRFENTD